jgi:hypothetical protein
LFSAGKQNMVPAIHEPINYASTAGQALILVKKPLKTAVSDVAAVALMRINAGASRYRYGVR